MSAHKNQIKAYFYASLTVFFWSTVATAFKIALMDMNNIQVLLVANTVSFIILGVVLALQKKFYLIKNSHVSQLSLSMLQGFLNPFLYYIIVFKAYSLLPAQVAQPANFVWPIVLMLLSGPILGQPIKITGILALCISFLGVLILSSQGNVLSFTVVEPLGTGLALLSSIIWSFFWIINLKDDRDDLAKLFLASFFSTVYIFILAVLTKDLFSIFHKSLLPPIYIGCFEMGITYIFWLKALKLSESTGKISNFIYLTPFVSLIFIHLILKEQIYYTSFIGLCLIIAGIWISRLK
ncbi:MAG: DMT family transporter [Syntrophorhabdaceae bacterium]|nr:DMT family transporter [Syntrophorhabdaceae bacterium]